MSRRSAAARRTAAGRAPEPATIVDLAHDGRGVARLAGKTVFVSDALPGEEVILVRTSFHGSYDEARLAEVVQPSPSRVTPECPHFGLCGGCALQHLAPAEQIRFKERQVREALERIGQVTPAQWLPPLQGDVWRYRRRARLGAKWVRAKGRVLVGFRERSAPMLADIASCSVLADPLGKLIMPLAEVIARLSLKDRIPQVEVAVAEGVTALVFRTLGVLNEEDRALLREFAAAHGVSVYLQPGDYSTVAPLDPAPPLRYGLPGFDVSIEFEPADFIQVNADLNRRMVSLAVELLELAPEHRVLDLFSGLGNFSLPMARRAAWVVGVDGDEGLIARARENAQRNGLGNATFHAANLSESVGGLPWAQAAYDRVLLDPPRAGAVEMLPVVDRSGAARVVYVSCHPATLARDAGLLVREHGFALTHAGVMDMFPHTAHVESIAVFDRRA